jgi:DNA-binding CsgD family transcriptional regulator
VLLLDTRDRVVTRDARATELLDGCATTGSLPGAVHVLTARVRASGDPARGRTLTADGAWISIDANPVIGDDGGVTVVLRPAPPPSVLDVRLRAAGLTEREREIALALLRGDDTATIAAALHLSPWTVQDHLKAIFDKTGVRSRRAFVARWALELAGAA